MFLYNTFSIPHFFFFFFLILTFQLKNHVINARLLFHKNIQNYSCLPMKNKQLSRTQKTKME